jgi:hypothetical protein
MAEKELIAHYRKLIEEWREDIALYKSGARETFSHSNGARTNVSKEEVDDLTHKIEMLTRVVAAYEKKGS